jgi:hypothetical protein
LARKPIEKKKHLEDVSVNGRILKNDLKETGLEGIARIHLSKK